MANEKGKHVCIPSEEEKSSLANEIDVEVSIHCGEENEMPNDIECPLSNHSGQHNDVDCQISIHCGEEIATTEEINDKIYNHIDRRLRNRLSQVSSSRRIFKVPDYLRNVNKKAYEPHILAIGPYHRDKAHLQEMEEHKVHYLKKLLQQNGEDNLRSCVLEKGKLEAKARACYIESVDNIKSKEFVEMMLLDACFIVQLVWEYPFPRVISLDENDNPLLKGGWIMTTLCRDLLLVENQLPFFVLQKFFDITVGSGVDFFQLVCCFFHDMMPTPKHETEDNGCMEIAEHLLDLIHRSWFPLCSKIRNRNDSIDIGDDWSFIRCTTELKEAGIKFIKDEKGVLFDIAFKNGTLEIPTLKIDHNSEPFFRNVIAHEMFSQDLDHTYFTDYLKFMDCLMNTSKDVELLCQHGIIDNGLGDDEVLARCSIGCATMSRASLPISCMLEHLKISRSIVAGVGTNG